nr:MMPL family transporter [Oscillospiraceae bacterium]
TSLGNQLAEIIQSEVNVIMVIVAIIVVSVLVLTSQTYAEIPVLALTFVSAMVLNMGTNSLLGKISFVSNSVTSILQLALSLDYAVIVCNRFKEEHQTLPVREAAIVALSKGIPEIGASSLTTIGGLVAMLFMQFRLGPDMGICLIKAILYALLSVFVVMPGLLVLFGPLMDKTRHRSFIPKVPFVGKFAYATRRFVPLLFVALVVFAYFTQKNCPYVYGYDTIVTPKLNEQQIAANMMKENFTSSNLVALVVPTGDYEKERLILDTLDAMPEVNHTTGLANTEALGGYMLTDRLTPRQFAELADIDYELAQLVYSAYAAEQEDYGKLVGGVASYGVPLIDMFLFVCDCIDEGLVTLDEEKTATLNDAAGQMRNGMLQLQGEEYSRMLVYLNLPESGDETYAFTDTIAALAQEQYPDGRVYVVGNSTNAYEFKKSFARDNVVVSLMSILIVLVVLLFTFKSVGMPLLLILVIEGSIFINFSIPVFTHVDLFFIAYLIVSSIQMGANIDYAIVIASRYTELQHKLEPREAIIETMNFAFPTILTSGSILASAGFILGRISSEGTIVGIGQSLGRGTVISILLVMFALPQILLVGGRVIEKTSFSMPNAIRHREARGRMVVDGMVRGEIHGTVTGILHATVEGTAQLELLSGSTEGGESHDA